MSLNNRGNIIKMARKLIDDEQYLDNWFGADSFFGTHFITGTIKRKKRYFFITRDEWMGQGDIYAVREITHDNLIQTVAGPLHSEEDARNALEGIIS